jgi:hypothetical protein
MRSGKKTIYRGITYRSNQEVILAKLFDENKLKFKYEPYTIEVFAPFTFHGKKIRPITYTPDFLVNKMYVEVKGWLGNNKDFPLRKKLFLKYLTENEPDYDYEVVTNKKEMLNLIEKLKNGI